jgi:hypothetical protein
MVVERFKGGLPAEGISDEHDHEIDHVILPAASPGEADLLFYRGLDTLMSQMRGDERHFPEPHRGRRYGVRARLDRGRRMRDTGHVVS